MKKDDSGVESWGFDNLVEPMTGELTTLEAKFIVSDNVEDDKQHILWQQPGEDVVTKKVKGGEIHLRNNGENNIMDILFPRLDQITLASKELTPTVLREHYENDDELIAAIMDIKGTPLDLLELGAWDLCYSADNVDVVTRLTCLSPGLLEDAVRETEDILRYNIEEVYRGIDIILSRLGMKTIKDREYDEKVLEMQKHGMTILESTNYKLSEDYICPHCGGTVLDNLEEYTGPIKLEDNYQTRESILMYLESDDGHHWITDMICSVCDKPVSIINGC